ncbi:indolepyruvate ferredoxin oxidoreductase [Stella humosa]|uniref:Indolepyruvate ferredoxin oxidoreductase n=1 Tax=Stella humosa TaxID=94 RepID=A0A3N1L0R5_9PROT|nr:indolepyruvate ferredoxin oxidoreductase family protein [Stella humosa]ROP83105.1 indolepyruvate ferredoxin oxidoreductase [Stella humosa]BBK30118.1 indolepyruvate ferredoxin oxidoreductase [Stella humosa]
MALAAVSLDDKYALESGRIFLTGTQALVRLPMMQRQRDLAAGLNTACFISGYRGSPLGGLDQALASARRFVEKNHIRFQPGVNEDLAATAILGSQQLNLFPDAKYDGVFSMWYGKGPGVDRSGDVFKHGNSAGTSPHGGVLLLAGDDHTCKSSTLAHQSEFALMDAFVPVLNPAGVQEFLDLGLHGWAMSRYSACWVGFKTVAETVDSAASVHIDPSRLEIVLPTDFEMPPGGLNVRWPDDPLEQEKRLHLYKVPAALAYARANRLDRAVWDGPRRRFGIVTTGKSYLDVRQALEDLGIDEAKAAEIGLSIYKVAMVFPLETEGLRAFAQGLEEVLVVEEKRAFIETQLKDALYNLPAARRPVVSGKRDPSGRLVLPSQNELLPSGIARVIADRIERFHTSDAIRARLALIDQQERQAAATKPALVRTPYFCSGCPHNTSTRVPEGSRAVAGIGCHYMAVWMDRDTQTFTQMGGEGASWVGQAPFSNTKHIFANIGDGTYFHSGYLAIRFAVASKTTITYKILFNDAVAMTGGQRHDGDLNVPAITRQVHAEGVRRIAVVTDEPDKYPIGTSFAPGVTIHHRDDLDAVQRELRECPGVSVLVYDQTCAAEKRRRRKRGTMADPQRRAFINESVCEGCGDCSVKSNCLSVVPVETEFGRKRTIDQSSCNKDLSCVKGFCPSFVTVEGGQLRKRKAGGGPVAVVADPPEPTLPPTDRPYGMIVTGVGGTGVVTIGALLGMAAHIEGKGCSTLDMTGLAQKGGAVFSHVRIAARPEDLHATRISAGAADLILACDMVVAASADAMGKIRPGVTRAVVNSQATVTGEFTRNPDFRFPADRLEGAIRDAVGVDRTDFVDATRIATALLGDSIAANLFMLGFAYQRGLIPVSGAAIESAIELNAVAVEFNRNAFRWGRRAAHDRAAVEQVATPPAAVARPAPAASLADIVALRVEQLTAYQNAAYAGRYAALVARVEAAERGRARGMTGLAEAVARNYYKLLAYKDEYEVARLYTDGTFRRRLEEQFEGDFKLRFHLAPPLLAERDEAGRLKKRAYGPWMMSAFGLLAKLKFLRGGAFDPFGRTAERRGERQLIADYETAIEEVMGGLVPDNHRLAVEIASLPERIRGYGHVKEESLKAVRRSEAMLRQAFREPAAAATAAE